MTEPVSLGPWRGIDNFHSALHQAFQPGEAPAALVGCENFDLDDSGWPTVRAGLTEQTIPTDGTALFPFHGEGVLLIHDGTTLSSIDPNDSFAEVELITGLSDSTACIMCEHASQVFVSDDTIHKVITSKSVAKPWGLTVAPTPTLGTTSGDLAEGRYLISCTPVDSTGNEHGCGKSATITTNGSQDITVDLSAVDASATHVNVYTSVANGPTLYWAALVAVGDLPYTLTDVRVSDRPLRNQHLRGPISMDGIASFLGYLLLYKDNYIVRSEGLSHHLFNLKQGIRSFPHNIKSVIGLRTGFWVTTERGSWFVAGAEEPASWSDVQKDNFVFKFAKGGIAVPGTLLPFTQTRDLVALFVSEVGLAIGLPTGDMLYPHQYQLSLDVEDKQASFAIDSAGDIIFSLR